jgi:hypothetical protein
MVRPPLWVVFQKVYAMNDRYEFSVVLFSATMGIALATIAWAMVTMASMAIEHWIR